MRSSKSRSRSKTNRPRTLGNVINRVFDSSGPEGKVRGTPAQLIEKYQFLANDARLSNDRVAAENFLQHAEHYTRLLAEANREMAAEQESRPQFQQPSQNGGNQTGGNQTGGQSYQNGQNNQNSQNQQRDRQQYDRPQGDRPQNDRQQNDRQQNDRQQSDRQQSDRQDFRAEPRQDYRRDVSDEQPIVTSHDLVDHVRYEDAGLVETPEAAPKPRTDEPRRNDRPRYDRNRDDNRRTYPPRVEQALAEAGAETPAPHLAPVVQTAPAPQPVAASQPVQSSMMPMMPQMPEAEPALKPAPKPRAKPVQAETGPAATVAADAPKPRLAPRPRAAKKPVDGTAAPSSATDTTD